MFIGLLAVLFSSLLTSSFVALTQKELRSAKALLSQNPPGKRFLLGLSLPDAKETELSPFWFKLIDQAARFNPELLETAVNIGGTLFVPERNTHGELGEDSLDSFPRMLRYLDGPIFLDYCKAPDLLVAIETTKPPVPPEPGVFKFTVRHFYNPKRKGTMRGEKGLAKEEIGKYYALLEKFLASGNIKAVSMSAGILSHHLCDLIIPYHAIGKLDGNDWVKERVLEHVSLEYAFAKKRRRAIVAPHYIPGGLSGVLIRVEREASISNSLARKSSSRLIMPGQNPFTEKEMDEMYVRAVQLTTDVLYTALVNFEKGEWLDFSERAGSAVR